MSDRPEEGPAAGAVRGSAELPRRLRRRLDDELAWVPDARIARPERQDAPTPAVAPLVAAAEPARVGGAEPAGDGPIESPRFVPGRNPRLAELEQRRDEQLGAERAARSTSDEVLPADRRAARAADADERARRRGRRRFRSIALAVAGGLAVAGFIAGILLDPFAGRPGDAAEATTIPLAHPQPDGVPPAALQPGACLAVWEGPWASSFSTTDCTGEHAAQLIADVPAAPFAGGAYPGEEALAARAQFACQSADALDPAAASAVTGLRIDVAYAPSAAEWDAGEQRYRCFASRADGGPLTGSLARSGA